MTSNPYDPKLLEAWFRFMAEATRAGSGASEAFQQASGGRYAAQLCRDDDALLFAYESTRELE